MFPAPTPWRWPAPWTDWLSLLFAYAAPPQQSPTDTPFHRWWSTEQPRCPAPPSQAWAHMAAASRLTAPTTLASNSPWKWIIPALRSALALAVLLLAPRPWTIFPFRAIFQSRTTPQVCGLWKTAKMRSLATTPIRARRRFQLQRQAPTKVFPMVCCNPLRQWLGAKIKPHGARIFQLRRIYSASPFTPTTCTTTSTIIRWPVVELAACRFK